MSNKNKAKGKDLSRSYMVIFFSLPYYLAIWSTSQFAGSLALG